MDKVRFNECINKYAHIETKYNIGTYMEKSLHKVIKNYYCDDKNSQEIKVGKVISDICIGNDIIEVQTRNLNKLVPKLKEYGDDYYINIVYPIPHIKYVCWINQETGLVTDKRKSPKVGKIYDAFYELYKIKWFLNKPNILITLLLIDMEEYRNLDGWSKDKKRGSSREERIPIELIDEVIISDYHIFIPDNLPEAFTSNEYSKAIKTPIRYARIGLNILQYIGIVEVVGKNGRNNLYKVK